MTSLVLSIRRAADVSSSWSKIHTAKTGWWVTLYYTWATCTLLASHWLKDLTKFLYRIQQNVSRINTCIFVFLPELATKKCGSMLCNTQVGTIWQLTLLIICCYLPFFTWLIKNTCQLKHSQNIERLEYDNFETFKKHWKIRKW